MAWSFRQAAPISSILLDQNFWRPRSLALSGNNILDIQAENIQVSFRIACFCLSLTPFLKFPRHQRGGRLVIPFMSDVDVDLVLWNSGTTG